MSACIRYYFTNSIPLHGIEDTIYDLILHSAKTYPISPLTNQKLDVLETSNG